MFFRGVDVVRRLILNLIFWAIVVFLIGIWIFGRPPRVRRNTVLKLEPNGILVDSSFMDYQELLYGEYTALDDLITAISTGQNDKRIQGMWLDLNSLKFAGPAAAGELADTIKEFVNAGKPVIASANYYDTTGYRIASAANHIVLDRMGDVFPTGYDALTPFFAEGLEKLGAEVRLFRTGESKNAAEGLIRNDISETSRRDKERLYGDLWDVWLNAVAANRGINPDILDTWISNYDHQIMAANGNASAAAMDASLIDEVETGGVLKQRLDTVFGEDNPYMDALDYRAGLKQLRSRGIVAVVPIVGVLVSGTGVPYQETGSTDVLAALETAQSTSNVAAIVLRIDSPGGDARAAEDIRRGIQQIRNAVPVVVSMGNYAASGGYWIAIESDAIFARPETVTGAIGVYAFSVTFEKGLADWLGVRFDGVGTTPWSGMGSIGQSMNDRMASIYNSSVMDVDILFRNLVAAKRGLSEDELNAVSGGMAWSGQQALNLGLVDMQGSLRDAVSHAADLAGLTEWQTRRISPPRDISRALITLLNRIQIRHSIF